MWNDLKLFFKIPLWKHNRGKEAETRLFVCLPTLQWQMTPQTPFRTRSVNNDKTHTGFISNTTHQSPQAIWVILLHWVFAHTQNQLIPSLN